MKFTVAHDHPSLPGHFPGAPIVPGVVLLERVLQAIELASGAPVAPLRLPRVKFLRPLLPGETAEVEVEALAPTRDGARRWQFRVLRGDELLATGEVAAA